MARAAAARLVATAGRRPLPVHAGSAAAAATAAAALGGPVAAAVAGAYTLAAGVAIRRWHARRHRERSAMAAVEAVGVLLGDLRAGLAPSFPGDLAEPAAAQVKAALVISERLGAPLADVLDRVEADLRSARRLRAMVGAQVAGVRATAQLLAALPLAGAMLGAGLGADPVYQLLHTQVGAACVVAAMAMQAAGLSFTAWLTGRAVAEAS